MASATLAGVTRAAWEAAKDVKEKLATTP